MSAHQHFQAAPKGDYCGTLNISDSGYSLRIVVIPKLWANRVDPRKFIWESSQPELVVEVAETQKFVVVAQASQQAVLLERLADLVASDSRVGRLLGLTRVKHLGKASEDLHESLELALISLGLRHGVVELTTEALSDLSFGLPGIVDNLVLFASFVEAARDVMASHRAGYVEIQSSGPLVKGRPNALDVALVQAQLTSSIRSRFYQITSQTPLMIVLASALRNVILESSIHSGTSAFDSVRTSASDLLHHWPAEPLPAESAIALVSQAEVATGDALEEMALSLGKLVLSRQGQLSDSLSGSLVWFQVDVDMSRLWEILVVDHLRSAGYADVLDGNSAEGKKWISAPAPWKGLSSNFRRPDLAFREQGGWHLGDAKYKRLLGKTPDANDVNQVFMYSTLATIHGSKPIKVDLVYPTRSTPSISEPYCGEHSGIPPLYVREVPFPSPEGVLSS